jgi:two-component system response regulator HydG
MSTPAPEREVSARVLLVDDDRDLCQLLAHGLRRRGFDVLWRTSASEALDVVGETDIDAIVTDLNMNGMNGLEFCERIVANRPDVPVTVLTGFGTLETAVAAIRAGAYDFLTKPPEIEALAMALERAVQHRALRDEVKRLRRVVEDARGFGDLLGASPKMRQLYDLLAQVGSLDASVLLTGESGTGKELVARALHRSGRRSSGPFVAINCAAVPAGLLESEMFGHVRGAFTDARTDRAGLFVKATGGTLFLDEIAEMPLELQPKLLRALQERAVRPLGADAEVPYDARVIAATNHDLETAVEERRFREDLYFRINVIRVDIPPLRARGGDVLLLAQHFVDRYAAQGAKRIAGLSSPAAERLVAYAWPGNVRELQNCMERAVALARFDQLTVDDLPEKIRNYKRSHVVVAGDDPSELVPLEEVERRYILRVLEAVRGNKTAAAQVLGLDRKTLYRKLERYN